MFIASSNTNPPRIDPNPTYSFLPIVIAKNLRSAAKLPIRPGRPCRGAPLRGPTSVVAVELKFNHLYGLFRSRNELPFLQRIETCLDQQRVATQRTRSLHAPIRTYDHFYLHPPLDLHPPPHFAISLTTFPLYLPLSLS